jgi:putative ABC transport system permease protein
VVYDAIAYLREVTAPEQRAALEAIAPSGMRLYAREESAAVKSSLGQMDASLVVPEDPAALTDFIRLFTPGGKPADIPASGVLLTEKLARDLNVPMGGDIILTMGGGAEYTVFVAGIVENYVLHYIYMSPEYYSDVFEAAPYPNSLLLNGTFDRREVLRTDSVRAIVDTASMRQTINDSTDALGVVTIVLLILSCALSFVVLFNLTIINIAERRRELATVKVLGFQDGETAMYIYRENFAVTSIGIVLGMIGGVFLNGFVLSSVEIDLLKFPNVISVSDFTAAAVLSLVFALFVNIVTYRKLTGIDMVESLKGVE